jgi:hypothetical protein
MSIWCTDLAPSRSWPAWFLEYRRVIDAEMHDKIAAHRRGELTDVEFRAWVLQEAERHARWVDGLPADRRAWIEAEEKADQHVVTPPGTPASPHIRRLLEG